MFELSIIVIAIYYEGRGILQLGYLDTINEKNKEFMEGHKGKEYTCPSEKKEAMLKGLYILWLGIYGVSYIVMTVLWLFDDLIIINNLGISLLALSGVSLLLRLPFAKDTTTRRIWQRLDGPLSVVILVMVFYIRVY